jgi:two-component system, LuxR family, sensor histidine kinase DctS
MATVVAIGWAGQRAAQGEADALATTMRGAAENYALGLQSAHATFKYLPYTVSRHPDVLALLAEPDNPALRQRVNVYLEEVNRRAGSLDLYVMDTRGLTLAASNWAEPARSFVGNAYANRPYFIDASAGRSGLFYGVGLTTGVPGLFVAAPARDGDAIVGVVAVKVSLAEIETAWKSASTPIFVTDQRGIVFLGTVPLYRSTSALSPTDLDWLKSNQQYGAVTEFAPAPWTSHRGQGERGYLVRTHLDNLAGEYLAFDKPLPRLGWTLTVMTDRAPVAQARHAVWLSGGLGAGLLLLGGLYWRLREKRRIERRAARQEVEQRVREDLTQRVQEKTQELQTANQALQKAHTFRKAMEDSLVVGMRARDLEGRIVYVNPALCEITGYSAEELVGRLPPYPYWHPDDLEKHWRESSAALSGHAALTGFESRIRHRDGHDVHTMVYTAPLIDADGRHGGWMSSVVDITAQKQADERQRAQDERLQRTERLAIVGEMASTLAHELNQPLMALANFSSAARAFADQDQPGLMIESLDGIKAQAQRAAEIVRRIRVIVRQRTEGGARAEGAEDCALNDIVARVCSLVQPELRLHQARLSTRLANGLPAVRGDRVLLEQVLLNLAMNGLQAMQHTPVGQRVLEIETAAVDSGVRVRVADRGPGVGPEIATQLFEPFFTTKADGLGLGLNICRTIVESHGGRLSFDNRADGGAIFTVTLDCRP